MPGETVVALMQIRWDVKQKMTYQWFPLPGKAHAVKVGFEQAIAPVLQRVTNIDDDAAGLGGAVIPFVYLPTIKSLLRDVPQVLLPKAFTSKQLHAAVHA